MSYAERKENAREIILDKMEYIQNNSVSWYELAEIQGQVERLARRYGLITELKDNGIL